MCLLMSMSAVILIAVDTYQYTGIFFLPLAKSVFQKNDFLIS